jgi:hypothetical protein
MFQVKRDFEEASCGARSPAALAVKASAAHEAEEPG